MQENPKPEIIFEVKNNVGIITLNRPQALNAINLSIIRALNNQLTLWENQANINAVLIQAAGERAFCAGGDIRAIYLAAKQQHASLDDLTNFFAEEYQLNQYIKQYSKPYIALMDGITMGGGVGISVHGSYRIATERLSFAMPETAIGFFPDVGGSYFLPRCPGRLGYYLALTGYRLTPEDALYIQVADYLIPSNTINKLIEKIVATHIIENSLQEFSITSQPAPLGEHRAEIDYYFGFNTIEEILSALENDRSPWSQNTLQSLLTKSPTSLKVTLAQLQKGLQLDFPACMQMELKLARKFLTGHDFFEGIRAILIDKDAQPHWQPATLKDIDAQSVNHYFD